MAKKTTKTTKTATKAVAKPAAKKAAAKKAVTKSAAKKPVAKKVAAKPAAKKPVAKKAAAKPAAKKSAAKPAAKKAVAKPVAKKAAAKSAAKPVAKKAAAKPAAKAAPKKAPAAKTAKPTKATTTATAKTKAKTKTKTKAKSKSKAKTETPEVRKPIKLAVRTTSAKTVKPDLSVKAAANAPRVETKPRKVTGKVKADFATNEYIVYPTHGVGKITGIEEQEVSGLTLQLFVIDFAQDKMTLRVPLAKAKTSGMRRLSTVKEMDQALVTLKGRARVKRTMWSRRAQEYEAKINSGDPISIAEVVRDLHRNSNQPDQSYSERQIYEAALGRLAREFAAVDKTDEESATEKLEGVLQAA